MGIRKRCETQHRLQLGTRAPGMRQPGRSQLDLSLAFSQSFPSTHPVLAQALCCLSSRMWEPSAARSSVHVCSHPPVVTPRRTPERPASGFLKIHWKLQPIIQNLEACMRGVLGAGVRGKALQSMRLTDVLIAGAFEL